MPRVSNEKKKSAKEIAEQIAAVEEAPNLATFHRPKKEKATKKGKKPFNYPLAYVIISILVFGLGILTICLINYWTSGSFSL